VTTTTRNVFASKPQKRIDNIDGAFALWSPGGGIVATRISGYMHHDFAEVLIAELERSLGRGLRLSQFHDWFEVERFDIRCQADLTSFHARHRAKLERLDILCTSNLVRMGVAVANVPLRGLIALHSSRLVFENEANHTVQASMRPKAPL
jgi:hypothetical protein